MSEHNNNDVWPQVERRKKMADGVNVTLEDVWELKRSERPSIGARTSVWICQFRLRAERLGQADYDGHRRAHLQQIRTAEAMEGYKQEGTKGVIKAVIGFIVGVFSLGIVEWIRTGVLNE